MQSLETLRRCVVKHGPNRDCSAARSANLDGTSLDDALPLTKVTIHCFSVPQPDQIIGVRGTFQAAVWACMVEVPA